MPTITSSSSEAPLSKIKTTIPFERYDEEFLSLTTQIKSTLGKIDIESSTDSGNSTEDTLRMARNLITQANDLIQQMSIEARGITNNRAVKEECLKKVRICKANLANLQDDVKTIEHECNRNTLGISSASQKEATKGGISNDTKERLLQTNQTLNNQNASLDNARRVMSETEEVALDITFELERNRETMESARSRVRNVSGLTNQARRILVNMRRREVQQKMIVYGIGFLLLLFVLFMLHLI